MTREQRAIILTNEQAELILNLTGNVDWMSLCTDDNQRSDVCMMRLDIQQQIYKQEQLRDAWAEYRKAQKAIMDAQGNLEVAQVALEALDEQTETAFEEQTRLLKAVYRVKDGDLHGITTDGITIIPAAAFERLTEICEKNGLNIYDLL